MNNFFYDVMDKLNVGIILLDANSKIVYWNRWMFQKTDLKMETVFNCPIEEVAPKFVRPKYQKILQSVRETGQGRFLAGAVHGSFFIDIENDQSTIIQQNLQIERSLNGYLLIQVEDYTGYYQKVQKMKTFIMQLEKENDQIKINEENSRKMAMQDILTGLPNRLFLMNQLRNKFENAMIEDENERVAIFFIDLDNLKVVNDSHGHRSGDAILIEMAKRLKHAIRGKDTVARLSGDEFIIVMEGLLDNKDIRRLAGHILDQFNEPFNVDGFKHEVTCSMGISVFPDDGKEVEELLDKADQALYKIKHSGKAGFAFYNRTLEE